MTGFPAATAAAKSPPEIPLKAKREIVRSEHDDRADRAEERTDVCLGVDRGTQPRSVAAEAAACRNWFAVRGNSALASRGSTGRAVSWLASETSSAARASIRSA